MSSTFESLFPVLFPIFTMATTIGLILFFLYLKKLEVDKPLRAKEASFTKPYITVAGIETGPPLAPFVKEGFSTSMTFPRWTGASMRFGLSLNDGYYKQYADYNLGPSADMIELIKSLPVSDKVVPNYGSSLSNFDADITAIPWDADNMQYLESDIVWGHVTNDASASLFLKAYHRKLLSDPANLMEGEKAAEYYSPLLSTAAYNQESAILLQLHDASVAAVGQSGLDSLQRRLGDFAKKSRMDALASSGKLDAILKNRATGKPSVDFNRLSPMDQARVRQVCASTDRNDARNAKLKSGQALNAAEASEHKTFNKFNGHLNPTEKPVSKPGKIGKVKVPISGADKMKIGVKKAIKFMKNPKALVKAGAAMAKKMAAVLSKMIFTKVVTGFTTALVVVADTAAVVTAGIAAPLAVIAHLVHALWTAMDVASTIAIIALQVLLPTLLDRSMKNGASCPEGKPFDILIEDDFLYFIVTTFIPFGGVMDAFGPYTCYKSDGSIVLKTPLYIPPYFADTSLSTYKHTYLPSQRPRGDNTSYKSNTDSLPPGWTVTAGIARSPCDPGTWTSSDVDMLCNISTYVPETYTKKSAVPVTSVKVSRVPVTSAKNTYIMTYSRGGSRGLSYEAGLQPCEISDPKSESRGWADCYMKGERKDYVGCCHWGWSGAELQCRGACVYTVDTYTMVRSLVNRQRICDPGYKDKGTLTCWAQCNDGDDDWGIFPLCTQRTCRDGYDCHAGVGWQRCRGDQHDVGALCRDKCRSDEYEVLGVCWTACPAGSTDVGALCRAGCSGDTPNEVLGVCWGSCGSDIDVGALCRKRCRDGFHEVAGVCWGNTGTYARESMIPKSTKIYDPGYNPPKLNYTSADVILDESQLGFPYCNYASSTMMDRMAQFYYDHSTLNPVMLSDGRAQFEYFTMIYGVIASSEFSCDIACAMKTVRYDPITGGNYEESYGTIYPDEPGNTVSYRRFYFYRATTDRAGEFTVTGCTHADYTAPDAHNRSTDEGVDPLTSVPKIFNVIDKQVQPGTWDMHNFKTALAATATQLAISTVAGSVGGRAAGPFGPTAGVVGGMVGGVGGGVAGGMAAQAVRASLNKVDPLDPGAEVDVKVIGNDTDGFFVTTNNDNYSMNHGPIYETRARDKNGYIPSFNFCSKIVTTPLLCSHELVLRDTVDLYHTQNPTKHIKTLYEVEPRGIDGCYYKWSTTSYDAATNTEGTTINTEEVVRKYVINDTSTCVFAPTNTFVTDMASYPIRSYFDTLTQTTVYPTRDIKSKAMLKARFVRIRPSTTSDGFMQLAQVAVYDDMGINLAVGKAVFASSLYNISANDRSGPPNLLVTGQLATVTGQDRTKASIYTYQNNGSAANDYIDIDLGMNYNISSVVIYSRIDIIESRNAGIRVQLMYTNGISDTPVKELVTLTNASVNTVDFSTQTTISKYPVSPFAIPRPLPVETTLGGSTCPARCQDKPQIDSLVQQYNSNPANSSSQIIKVLRATTPTTTRCDYEVEMVRKVGTKSTVAKELISMAATLANNTPNTGTVYGRFIRVRPAASGGDGYLSISQIVVSDVNGRNLALNRPAYGTSRFIDTNNTICAAASIVTDGTLTAREWPNVWVSETTERNNEFLEIDLGISQPITSITYYSRSGATTPPRIQVLVTNDTIAVPISDNTLPNANTQQTLQFNKCTFSYATTPLVGNFIQDNTPLLTATDTSGGVLTFKNIGATIMNVFNSIINPIKTQDPLNVLNKNVDEAQKAAQNTLNSVAANQTLQGCPNTKCSDPAVLAAIVAGYNNANVSTEQYNAETNTMIQIAKAGIAGPNTCDVLFTNLYDEYDDYLYAPIGNSEKTVMTKRFTLTNTGNCVMAVAPGGIIDVSMNAIGIISASSALTTPYSTAQCKVNCRDPAILTSLKAKLNTQYQTTSILPNFTTVTQSFLNGYSTCEYMMTKDVTTKNTITGSFSTETALDTYVTATFNVNPTTCAATLNTVTEFDPDLITITTDNATGDTLNYIKGVRVNLPLLFNYDNTAPSTQVNETVKII